MPNFTGTLRSNEIFSSIFNMIISQQVFSDNIAGTNSQLVDAARVDGSLYGDTKLYYAVDVLKSVPFVQDSQDMLNLLKTHRPADPECQAITISNFRRIAVTTDEYMSKRAWSTPDAFGQFNSVILGMLNDTRRVIDATTYNCFIGTAEGQTEEQSVDIPLSDITATGVEKNKLEGEMIAQFLADLIVDLTDVSRGFNDYKYLRSYDANKIKIIFNKKFVNKITKLAMPEIFNKEGLVDKLNEYALPSRYFGKVVTVDTAKAAKESGKVYRALVEQDIGDNHYFAGDKLAEDDTAYANKSYTEDADIIAKVCVELPPYMSAFEVSTSFYNASNLSTNTYLTFGRSDLEYLKNYPMITVHAS